MDTPVIQAIRMEERVVHQPDTVVRILYAAFHIKAEHLQEIRQPIAAQVVNLHSAHAEL